MTSDVRLFRCLVVIFTPHMYIEPSQCTDLTPPTSFRRNSSFQYVLGCRRYRLRMVVEAAGPQPRLLREKLRILSVWCHAIEARKVGLK